MEGRRLTVPHPCLRSTPTARCPSRKAWCASTVPATTPPVTASSPSSASSPARRASTSTCASTDGSVVSPNARGCARVAATQGRKQSKRKARTSVARDPAALQTSQMRGATRTTAHFLVVIALVFGRAGTCWCCCFLFTHRSCIGVHLRCPFFIYIFWSGDPTCTSPCAREEGRRPRALPTHSPMNQTRRAAAAGASSAGRGGTPRTASGPPCCPPCCRAAERRSSRAHQPTRTRLAPLRRAPPPPRRAARLRAPPPPPPRARTNPSASQLERSPPASRRTASR